MHVQAGNPLSDGRVQWNADLPSRPVWFFRLHVLGRRGHGLRQLLLCAALGVATGCESGRAPGGDTHRAPAPAPLVVPPTLVRGPSGGAAVEPFIAEQVKLARSSSVPVLVYVGAPWCEPCRHFHEAVVAHQLDALLSGARIIEFDLDVDRAPLEHGGYKSQLIPLFVVPRADGTASDARMEGSIKGESAVAQNLSPRLKALLERARQPG